MKLPAYKFFKWELKSAVD